MRLPSWPGAVPLGTPGSCLWTMRVALRGLRPLHSPILVLGRCKFAYAAGGRGRPCPLHSRPGAPPLGTPIRCTSMPNAWRTCLRAEWSRLLLILVSAYRRHAAMG